MYGYIYKTTNLINGKIYIGQKKSEEFLAEKYLGSGSRLKTAIEKYGKTNFKVIMIDLAESQDMLDKKEIFWIDFYQATDISVGYNLSKGGGSTAGVPAWNKGKPGKKASTETKYKMHLSRLNHKTSDETRAKISKSNSGKKRTEAQNQANSARQKGKIWIYKGNITTTIFADDDLEAYLADGWQRGRNWKKSAWNKGLTKDTDERVAKNALHRKDTMIRKYGTLNYYKYKSENDKTS